MHTSHRGWRLIAAIFLLVLAVATGWPAAFVAVHGWNVEGWPRVAGILTPNDWLAALRQFNLAAVTMAYINMAYGKSPAFADGGVYEVAALTITTGWYCALIIMGGTFSPPRDPSGPHGNATWASKSDIKCMKTGVEIGIDPNTGRAVRIEIEGNLVTIAPPRSGKTSGFIIPNLAYPDNNAWSGPVVVIDPKGDAYRAVRHRREALGRTVRCLDPLDYAGGDDRWNPLVRVEANDILHLQSMIQALLPQTKAPTDASAYFRSRAVDLMVGALLCSIADDDANLAHAADLLLNEVEFRQALSALPDKAARAALRILDMQDQSRDGIISTVQQATQWLRDERMSAAVQNPTFELSDLADGNTDLFIVLPADERKHIIAPYVRWLLADLFAMARHHTPSERIIVFLDEAYVLGRFDAILQGAGELPGYGISLWTIWQSRYQIEDTYGKDGAEILLGTAEMINLFDLPATQPDELQRWSDAIGTYSGLKTATSISPSGKTENQEPVPVALMPATNLPDFLKMWQIVFLTSKRYTRNPLKLRRTTAHNDPRFRGLIKDIAPVGQGQQSR